MPVNVNEIEPDEKIVEIEMERLREFRNHPFKVKADAKDKIEEYYAYRDYYEQQLSLQDLRQEFP